MPRPSRRYNRAMDIHVRHMRYRAFGLAMVVLLVGWLFKIQASRFLVGILVSLVALWSVFTWVGYVWEARALDPTSPRRQKYERDAPWFLGRADDVMFALLVLLLLLIIGVEVVIPVASHFLAGVPLSEKASAPMTGDGPPLTGNNQAGIGAMLLFLTPTVLAAILAASLTALLTYWLERRRTRQQICLRTAGLVACYAEELENGLKIMQDYEKRLEAAGGDPARVRDKSAGLPKAFWSAIKPDLDAIGELWRLGDLAVPPSGFKMRELPTHIKNCFEHIIVNYESGVELNAVNRPSLSGWIEGYRKTLDLCRLAVKHLDSMGRRRWPLPL